MHHHGLVPVPAEPVGDGEDGPYIIGRVAPLCTWEHIVVYEVPDERAQVEGGLEGVQHVGRARELESIWDNRSMVQ